MAFAKKFAFAEKMKRPVKQGNPNGVSAEKLERDRYWAEVARKLDLRGRENVAGLLRQCRKKLGKDAKPVFELLAKEHSSRGYNDHDFNEKVLKCLLDHGPGKVVAALNAKKECLRIFGPKEARYFGIREYCEMHDFLARAKRLPGKVVKQTFHFHGDVQDTGFRSWAKGYARAAGLKCIEAENMNDGSVRVILEGQENYQEAVSSALKAKFKVSKIVKG